MKNLSERLVCAGSKLVICACGLPKGNWIRSDGKNYNDVDVTIAMDHLILAATNEGLSTPLIGAFNSAEARKVLNLPEYAEPLALTPLGYPADQAREKRRKDLKESKRVNSGKMLAAKNRIWSFGGLFLNLAAADLHK